MHSDELFVACFLKGYLVPISHGVILCFALPRMVCFLLAYELSLLCFPSSTRAYVRSDTGNRRALLANAHYNVTGHRRALLQVHELLCQRQHVLQVSTN